MTTRTKATHDARAVEVVKIMRDIIEPDDILLFGSRARGDWHGESDIDILVVADPGRDTAEKCARARRAGYRRARELYGDHIGIDMTRYSPEDFQYYLQAPLHLTYEVVQDGISMSDERTDYRNRYEELPPNNWPDVEQSFTNYQREILAAQVQLEAGMGYEEVGHDMQRALENTLNGFLSYLGHDDGGRNAWRRSHDLEELEHLIREYPQGRETLGEDPILTQVEYGTKELNEYASTITYEGIDEPMQDEWSVLDHIRALAGRMTDFIEEDAGRKLPVYTPPGTRPRRAHREALAS